MLENFCVFICLFEEPEHRVQFYLVKLKLKRVFCTWLYSQQFFTNKRDWVVYLVSVQIMLSSFNSTEACYSEDWNHFLIVLLMRGELQFPSCVYHRQFFPANPCFLSCLASVNMKNLSSRPLKELVHFFTQQLVVFLRNCCTGLLKKWTTYLIHYV